MKRNFNFIPMRLRFFTALTAFFVFSLFLLRLSFFIFFKDPTNPLPTELLLHSFYLGTKFDLRLALVSLLPIMLFSSLRPLHLFDARLGRLFWHGYLTLITTLVLLIYFFDFGHFSYLNVRLNAAAVSLLEDTAISIEMLWETYPIIRILFAFLFIILLFHFVVGKLFEQFKEKATEDIAFPLSRIQKVVVIVFSSFLVILGMYGKISYYPLRWSDAFYSTNAFASSIAVNPVLYLIDTFRAGNKNPYDEKVVREHYDEMAVYLGIPEKERRPLNYTRMIPVTGDALLATNRSDSPPPPAKGAPNIVLIQLESFSYQKTGLYGGTLNATPYFNELSKKGIFFDQFFTPHWGTARAVFTTVTGLPDTETHNTSTRNPMVICQNTIINAFTGHDKFYFLGGSASWGNIRGLLSHNIPHLKIYEEGNFKSPRVDVWGISDLALFKEANAVLTQHQDKPFFAYIQTAGNHRPYTIPEDHGGFVKQSPNLAELTKNGFGSVEEWNAFRFLDHSIGKFLEIAQKEAYFENTFFIFFGDHGTPTGRGETTPAWESVLRLSSMHVPFLIYAPKLIPDGHRDSKIASQTDILPTLARLAKIQYKNTTIGRDLLDPQFDEARFAYTITHGTPSEIGLLADPYYFQMNDDKTNKRLHRRNANIPEEDLLAKLPEEGKQLERQLLGIHETSKYMSYHNRAHCSGSRAPLRNESPSLGRLHQSQ
ncbi:MAG: sulfatase-like hydrolase/transferase [Nitrospirota bacterium]